MPLRIPGLLSRNANLRRSFIGQSASLIGDLSWAQLYAVSFVLGCASVFFFVSYGGFFQSVVAREDFIEANSLLNAAGVLVPRGRVSAACSSSSCAGHMPSRSMRRRSSGRRSSCSTRAVISTSRPRRSASCSASRPPARSSRRRSRGPAARGPHWLVIAFLFTAEFLSGIGLMWLDILAGVLQGGLIPRWVRSRVSGAFMVVKYGVRPPGTTIAGVLGTTIGVHNRRSMREAGLAAAAVDQLDAVAVRLDTEVD